jgi:hypothetical protein
MPERMRCDFVVTVTEISLDAGFFGQSQYAPLNGSFRQVTAASAREQPDLARYNALPDHL